MPERRIRYGTGVTDMVRNCGIAELRNCGNAEFAEFAEMQVEDMLSWDAKMRNCENQFRNPAFPQFRNSLVRQLSAVCP